MADRRRVEDHLNEDEEGGRGENGILEQGENHEVAQEGGGDDEEQRPPQNQNQIDGLLLLHDLEHYIRSRGIENNNENLAPPNQNHLEAQQRVNEAQQYQEDVHKRVFGNQKDEEIISEHELKRKQLMDMSTGVKVDFVAANGKTIEGISLPHLIETCDTIFAMANSTLWMSKGEETTPSVDKKQRSLNKEIALLEFDVEAVEEFLNILSGVTSYDDMKEDHVVSCCKIAHFLQCQQVLDPLVNILIESVDSQNCLSLCSLADQLDLPPLFEASISMLTSSLDNVQDHELWEEFPTALQHRVITLRNAIYSSIMSRGQKAKLFFTSSDEFLAIFSDHIRDQKERLKEAKVRQEQIIESRRHHGGRHCDLYGGSVRDAEIKIHRQERRIQTLDMFYQEQKKIFRHSNSESFSSNDDDKQDPFVL